LPVVFSSVIEEAAAAASWVTPAVLLISALVKLPPQVLQRALLLLHQSLELSQSVALV
jgi:hypothetical protein